MVLGDVLLALLPFVVSRDMACKDGQEEEGTRRDEEERQFGQERRSGGNNKAGPYRILLSCLIAVTTGFEIARESATSHCRPGAHYSSSKLFSNLNYV